MFKTKTDVLERCLYREDIDRVAIPLELCRLCPHWRGLTQYDLKYSTCGYADVNYLLTYLTDKEIGTQVEFINTRRNECAEAYVQTLYLLHPKTT